MTPPEVEKARKVLQEGEELIAQRQKLIRIADISDHGWATVEEYVDDELADNSEDEKRLFKADVQTAKRLKTSKEKAKKQLVARGRLPFQTQFRPQIQTGALMYIGQRSLTNQFGGQRAFPVPVGREDTQPLKGQSTSLGPCFQCGKLGHF